MRGNVDTIKERLDITEVVSGYLKLEKAGQNYKAKCPFHNEKTPSFFISPSRQSFYCFGCGAKGDIFNFVEEMEGLDFKEALKILALKAGVELQYQSQALKTEKEEMLEVLERATEFFERNLRDNKEALAYLESRGIDGRSRKLWRLGYAQDEWRALFSHLSALGYRKELLVRAGLVKDVSGERGKNPYDVFRGRIIFPLFDRAGRVIAFSGREWVSQEAKSSSAEGAGPKYLNSPDSILFNKSEVLYGFDKAKESIRKRNFTVLVEGQLDLVLSHQAGVANTVASSGTAFTSAHLEKLKRLSKRVILAFDGDEAGEKAAEKSATLGLSLGMEVKIAPVPEGSDPADLVKSDPESWKEVLRKSLPSIEFFLEKLMREEPDKRKQGKLVEQKLLPMLRLVESAIERAHFVSMISKRTGIKEDLVWEDLRKVKVPTKKEEKAPLEEKEEKVRYSRRAKITRRLLGIIFWQEPLSEPMIDLSDLKEKIASISREALEKTLGTEQEALIFEAESYYTNTDGLNKDIAELLSNLHLEILRERVSDLALELAQAEKAEDSAEIKRISEEIKVAHHEITALEDGREKV